MQALVLIVVDVACPRISFLIVAATLVYAGTPV